MHPADTSPAFNERPAPLKPVGASGSSGRQTAPRFPFFTFRSSAPRPPLDPLTQATVTVCWVVAANKPLYPLYVWWLVGSGTVASLATMLTMPLFAAIALLARRFPFAARLALPLIGTLDTLFETKLFGAASGTALFLAACAMLAALGFRWTEKWWQRASAILIFLAYLAVRGGLGTPLHVWNADELASLFEINAFAVACLMAFIALRYAGVKR
ncbi:hypothetical protein [Rhizobium halophytocola]|uniref:Uncharacterized protein n=1 Tax=Rhizobium halophytocola TaxID=735519 RepID=A0ABS4DVG0_9HYPH|nr:hypothetical protein [Rhizobium halophytocola]MBP1849669.1 hypothetical protein [Rhizobium halophytocola]